MLLEKIKFANKEYSSIGGVLKAYYYNKKADSDLATYYGRTISLDIEDDEDKSLFQHVTDQIEEINKLLEVK